MLEEERFLLVKIINLFVIFLLVNSCTIVVSTAGSLVGNATTSTRGFSGTIEDTYLMSKIVSKITLMKLANFSNITVSVINGKVLLAGNIENQEKRLELIKKVWWIDGVEEVYNELEIGPPISFSEKTEDFIFEAKIEKRQRDFYLPSLIFLGISTNRISFFMSFILFKKFSTFVFSSISEEIPIT